MPHLPSITSENVTALKLFTRAARTASFSQAGRDLGISQPSVSRIIANLEKELGMGLFKRSTRVITLTEAGLDYLVRVEGILDALEEANNAIGEPGRLHGTLHVTSTSCIATRIVIPLLTKFTELYPDLKIDLHVRDGKRDLALKGIDVELREGVRDDSLSIARKLTTLDPILVAAPTYLKKTGTPQIPSDLALHRMIAEPHDGSSTWFFRKGEHTQSIKPSGWLSVGLNDAALLAATAGLGIAMTRVLDGIPELADGSLVRILSDWGLEPVDVYALYPVGRVATPQARGFTEFLVRELSVLNR